ncbi:MAG TPA: hypothetical protein VEZ90_17100 [Blastocatellia bacterium]|nr:hypothetical protein [Blastocatellia bacterium]
MSVTSTFEPYDRNNVFHDSGEWDHFLESIVNGNRESADSLGLVLYKLLRGMSEGPDGFERTRNTLKLGMERLFPLTTTHNLSFTLFLYEMECLLIMDDSPRNLIGAAIDRAESSAREIDGDPGADSNSAGEPGYD